MNLIHLKYQKCPICGARVVTETQERQHTNGQWNEYQTFECGYSTSWCPNFNREEVKTKCPNDPKEIARKKQLNQQIEIVKLNIEKSQLPKWIIEALCQKLEYFKE